MNKNLKRHLILAEIESRASLAKVAEQERLSRLSDEQLERELESL